MGGTASLPNNPVLHDDAAATEPSATINKSFFVNIIFSSDLSDAILPYRGCVANRYGFSTA
jgi:hypothetical protein